MTDYEAIVFDCDGVLVELTADAVLEAAAVRACEAVGIDDPAEAFVRCAVDEDLESLEAHHADHDVVVSGRDPTLDGARRRKPEPYYLERALDALGTRDALYVGDSPKDVAVAHCVGVDSAFLRREHRRDVALDREPRFDVPDLAALADRVG